MHTFHPTRFINRHKSYILDSPVVDRDWFAAMLGADVFGLLTGAVGLMSIVRAIWARYSPARLVEDLDNTLRTTEHDMYSFFEQGFIQDTSYVVRLRERLFL